jgi:hypothetical protein
MRSFASRSSLASLAGILAVSGCVTIQPPARRSQSDAERYARILDSVQVAGTLEADEVASAPRIHLVVPPASYASARYVEATFHVTDDAYVLVVAVDLDRRVRVLYPEEPDQSGFARKSSPTHLSRFFAGFGGARLSGYSNYSRYDLTQRISPFGGGGVLLAVASDRPLQLERIVDQDGDWDEGQLSRLVFDQSLSGAAHALGRALVLTGQEYNTDYSSFTGRRSLGGYTSLASNGFDDCSGFGGLGYPSNGFGYGYGAASSYDGVGTTFLGFYQRDGRTFARYASGRGACSPPVYYDVPVGTAPLTPPDTTKQDTVVVRGPRHFPGAPRFPSVTGDSSKGPLARRAPGTTATDQRPRERVRPPFVAGLRFRPPEQIPSEATRRVPARLSPSDVDAPARRRPQSSEREAGVQPSRPAAERSADEPRAAQRPTPVERRPEPRAEPRSEPRVEPVRSEPVRSEPVRSEPVRSEPARSEPVRSEPARSEPARSEPAPAPREPARPTP